METVFNPADPMRYAAAVGTDPAPPHGLSLIHISEPTRH